MGALIDELSSLRGMEHVAGQVRTLIESQVDQMARAEAGYPVDTSALRHVIITGRAGTGKSMVGKKLAEIYANMGITDSDKFVVVNAREMTSKYKGNSERQALKKYQKAQGGVLFVDEAHQLNNDSYGRQALQALLAPMADPNDRTVVIMAGYPGKMESMLASDEGLRSRFPTTLSLENYDAETLAGIVTDHMAGQRYHTANNAANQALLRACELVARNPNSGNARDALEKIYTWADEHKVMRLVKLREAGRAPKPNQRVTLTASDFNAAGRRYRREEFGG